MEEKNVGEKNQIMIKMLLSIKGKFFEVELPQTNTSKILTSISALFRVLKYIKNSKIQNIIVTITAETIRKLD